MTTQHLGRRTVLVLTASALLAGGLAACSSSGGSSTPGSTDGAGGAASNGSGSSSATTTGAHVANVTITAAHGCAVDHKTFAAGGITFNVTNKDATAVSEIELLDGERIIGEKENVPPGLSAQFAVRAEAGTYTLYCPGATPERTTVTVTGQAAPVDNSVAGLIKSGVADYKTYVDAQMGYLVQATVTLNQALQGTDLAAAQKAYMLARPFYEKVEPVAESFVNGNQNLDAEIDARINDVPRSRWSGFHLIEQALFQKRTLAGLKPWGAKLVADVRELAVKAKALTFSAPDLANGAAGLLDEVASRKITGEEERYSHIDVLDMADNIEGSQQAFADLQPVVQKIDPSLTRTISTAFGALSRLVNTYRTTGNPSGYVYYTALNQADKNELAAAVEAVKTPLSRVAGKVANA